MKPGPKPKPRRLRVVEGNPGHRPLPDSVELPPASPRKPAWSEIFPGTRKGQPALRRDADAAWKTIVPVLESVGLLSTIDVFVLVDVCTTWARIRQIERVLSEQGLMVEDRKERGWVRHPLATVANQYRANLRALTAELGLSPSARIRLDTPTPAPPLAAGRARSAHPAGADLLD